MSPNDKPLVWLEGEVRTPPFTQAARLEAGYLLRRLQQGENLSLPHSRPMPTVGKRCHELRIVDEDATWRIMYRTDPDAVIILDVFKKKSAQTPKRVIDACKRRIKEYEMRKSKIERLKKKGWKVGTVKEFLELPDGEAAYIELKLRLSDRLRSMRKDKKLSQVQLAEVLESSQSRIAKMEGGDPSVTIDLLVRALLELGASNRDLAEAITSKRKEEST